MSNAMDIVDARTGAGPAEVTHWMSRKSIWDRFFRQFFDIKNLGGSKGSELSAIRWHCMSHKCYNPNKTMYKCPHEDCGVWNHEERLVGAILGFASRSLYVR